MAEDKFAQQKGKRRKPDPRTEPEEIDPPVTTEDRREELSERAEIEEALLELYVQIERGWEDQYDRANVQMDYWELYNCKLSAKQYYAGNSKIFVPIVHDAVEARVTRFGNQIFPTNGRYIEVTTTDGQIPHGQMSLVEHYIRKTKMRTVVVPALLRNGDVEGQYNVYVDWQEKTRHVAYRKPKKTQAGDGDGIEDAGEPDDIIEKEVREGRPYVEVIADADILVLPFTANTISDALEAGGSVTILRRWSKSKIKQMIEDGVIRKDSGDVLVKEMVSQKLATAIDKPKIAVDAAGIKMSGNQKHALVYETWTNLTIGDERRLCKIYFGGEKLILSCKRNPNWNDRINLISCPATKVQGSFKGLSKLMPTEQIQYYANDAINEAADSSMFSMMPIVLTDPERNPRIGSMVLSLAAVWEADPNSTQFAKFPDLWKQGFEIVASCKAQIMQSLSVSPAAITQSGSQKTKPSQADVAREQQVDILTTADAVTLLEEGILTPVANFMVDLDHQYRKDRLLIRQFGEMGLRAKMDWIDPIQMDHRLVFRWFGVEQARTAMQMQQQISAANVLSQITPDKYPGYTLNLVPMLTQLVENVFGPRLAPLIFQDEKAKVSLDANLENEWMVEYNLNLAIHPQDDDAQHMQAHAQALQETGDPTGVIQAHLARHQMQMQMKQRMQLVQAIQAQFGGQQQGPPQGGQRSRPGAQSRPPRGGQGPPGMVNRDQLSAASGAPPALRGRGGM
ncbi:MAG TPA: hypothetical protein VF748_15090 [Candidatus Acidoferrum sp.]